MKLLSFSPLPAEITPTKAVQEIRPVAKTLIRLMPERCLLDQPGAIEVVPLLPAAKERRCTMAANIRFCQLSSVADSDWEALYEATFPVSQRTPLDQLREGIRNGHLLLHRTIDEKQGLLCFSITNALDSIALLAYLATDTTKRSGGIGSQHMKHLITEVHNAHPQLSALFAEIESTRAKGLDEETKKQRMRRLAFYRRLGFKRLQVPYTVPSFETIPGTPARDEEEELIFIDLHSAGIGCLQLQPIIKEIFVKAYGLKEDDSRVLNIPTFSGETSCLVSDSEEVGSSEPAASKNNSSEVQASSGAAIVPEAPKQ